MINNYKKIFLFLILIILVLFVATNFIKSGTEMNQPAFAMQTADDLKSYVRDTYATEINTSYFSNLDFLLCDIDSNSKSIKPDCAGRKGNVVFTFGHILQSDNKSDLEKNLVDYLIEGYIIPPEKEYTTSCFEVFPETKIVETNSNLTDCTIWVNEPTDKEMRAEYAMSVFYFNNDKEVINYLMTAPRIDVSEFDNLITLLPEVTTFLEKNTIFNIAHAGGGGGGGGGGTNNATEVAANFGTNPNGSVSGYASVGDVNAAIAGGMVATGPNTACCNENGDAVTGYEGGDVGGSGSLFVPICPLEPDTTSPDCAGRGGLSNCPLIPVCPPPPPPPPPAPVPAAPTSVNVSCGVPAGAPAGIYWPPVAGATYYQTRLDYQGDSAPYLVQEDNYPGIAFQFTPTLGTAYSTWVHACNASGCSAGAASTNFTCPPLPTLNFYPSSDKVDSGNSTNLIWTVTSADNCTAGPLGWSGSKNPNGGSQPVSPTITTQYDMECTSSVGSSGKKTVVIKVPDGFINAVDDPCTIAVGDTTCNVNLNWESKDFFGGTEVSQGSNPPFSTVPNSSAVKAISPDNNTFTLRDNGGSFVYTEVANVSCAPSSVWAGGSCVKLPEINIEANPNIVRNGNSAPVNITIDANYNMTCTLRGGIERQFTHFQSPSPTPYPAINTKPLTAGQIVAIDCFNIALPTVTGYEQTRIDVIPIIEER